MYYSSWLHHEDTEHIDNIKRLTINASPNTLTTIHGDQPVIIAAMAAMIDQMAAISNDTTIVIMSIILSRIDACID